MHIWLPPSEGKDSPTTGPALDLAQLSLSALTDQRRIIAQELAGLVADIGEDKAAAVLGLGAKSRSDLALNTALFSLPCAPMEQVFTGVLYSAAALAEIDEATRADQRSRLTVFSGLFGSLRFGDLIPDHRLSMGVKLPGVGSLASAWKPVLDAALREDYANGVVLDMRSGPYRSACPAQWAHVWQVGVVREANGKRSVVSHNAKYWRGLLTGYLLRLPSHDLAEVDQKSAADASSVEEILHSSTELPAMIDAKGVPHRITGVEFSEITPTKQGGSTRTVTLVTD